VTTGTFDAQFAALTGLQPFRWQARLFRVFANGEVPSAIDLPTGLGKTSVMALWLLARARGAALPRRLIYVVDRRAVVDQATAEAEKLRHGLDRSSELKSALGLGNRPLPISTLRGQFVDNREWLADPAAPAIIVGTVDMIGSRLLFSGYGVSPKMRPYHAGLLGADGLIVLDEAHLVPPFARLLRAIQQDASLWPRDGADRELLPRVAFLPLSATQRDLRSDERGRAPFRLEEIDWETDCVVKKRLNAKKRVRLTPLAENGQDKQLAATAWALATKDGKISRVAVFCNRREKSDEGGGPSAQGVKDEIEKLARADKRAQRSEAKIYPPELLVGARRVHERDGVAKRLHELGFIGEKTPLEKPAFLLATSAGEVGVDVDAEHMVSDLTAWERMVQRLGRVNRRGEGNAEIHVFWGEPTIKSADRPTESEKRALCAHASRAVIEKLPQIGGLFDASPAALRTLAEGARKDGTLKALIDAATTPEPLRPALNRALVDAWSLTSLQTHTGRPEVAPWLRGWIDDVPQTRIIWRSHLPLRDGIPDWPRTSAEKKEIEDFFEAAAPHESERLETETYRVASWLQKRAQALLARKRSAPKKSIEDETIEGEAPPVDEADTEASDAEEGAGSAFEQLGRDEIVALMLSSSGAYAGRYNLGYLAQQRKGDAKTEFEAELTGRVLVVDAQLGGLRTACWTWTATPSLIQRTLRPSGVSRSVSACGERRYTGNCRTTGGSRTRSSCGAILRAMPWNGSGSSTTERPPSKRTRVRSRSRKSLLSIRTGRGARCRTSPQASAYRAWRQTLLLSPPRCTTRGKGRSAGSAPSRRHATLGVAAFPSPWLRHADRSIRPSSTAIVTNSDRCGMWRRTPSSTGCRASGTILCSIWLPRITALRGQ
jgi:CRISPR-associated endonuclease/helicase Cas3